MTYEHKSLAGKVESSSLKGYMSTSARVLSGKLNSFGRLIGKIIISETAHHDTYDGIYTITPSFSDQTLNTADKIMSNDLHIKTIPYSEVSNESGGKTINIGG